MKKRLTIFDFDGTLTYNDSFLAFPCRIFGIAVLMKAIIGNIPSLLKWKFGRRSNSDAKQRLYSDLYRGSDKSALMLLSESFNPRFRKDIVKALEESKNRGEDVWIISASLDLWMVWQAKNLGVKLLCTETETDERGLLTGRFSTPNCYGEEKVRRLKEMCPNLADYYVTVYGDNPNGGDAALRAIADEFITVR